MWLLITFCPIGVITSSIYKKVLEGWGYPVHSTEGCGAIKPFLFSLSEQGLLMGHHGGSLEQYLLTK